MADILFYYIDSTHSIERVAAVPWPCGIHTKKEHCGYAFAFPDPVGRHFIYHTTLSFLDLFHVFTVYFFTPLCVFFFSLHAFPLSFHFHFHLFIPSPYCTAQACHLFSFCLSFFSLFKIISSYVYKIKARQQSDEIINCNIIPDVSSTVLRNESTFKPPI